MRVGSGLGSVIPRHGFDEPPLVGVADGVPWLIAGVERMGIYRHWLAACVLGVVMSTQTACGNEQRFAFHGLSYNQAVDMPQVDLLDCLYGDGLGAHTQKEVDAGQARRGECGNMFGDMPIGDFLYVKWRDKATQKVYEDRVDLKSRLPSPKEMHKKKIYFLIDDNQLYVYLIPDSDWDTRRNYLPIGENPNGPGSSAHLDVKTLYPDNSLPKIRGGRMSEEYYEKRIREMHQLMQAEKVGKP